MRQGITQTKTQLSEWVFQASRSQALPPDPTSGSNAQVADGGDEVVVIDKKDPILLALEKETSAFDPNLYLRRGDVVEGPESLWLTTEVYYQTRLDMIKGNVTFKLDHMTFEALSRNN